MHRRLATITDRLRRSRKNHCPSAALKRFNTLAAAAKRRALLNSPRARLVRFPNGEQGEASALFPGRIMTIRGLRMVVDDIRGTSAIEFALVLPALLILVLGILAYGIYFGAVHSTTQLAADAARASVAGLSDSERASIAMQQVTANASSYPLLMPQQITVSAGPLANDATEFQVSVTYDASALPIWSFAKILPLPSKTIVRTATIKRGGY